MKECEKYAALLDAFSEGDLFMEDMVQVQTHLMNCPDCQAYLEDLLAIRAAFPSVEDTEVPEGFSERVMAAVAEHPRAAAPAAPAKQKKAPWGRVLVSLAACCAIVILMKTPIFGGGSSRAEEAAVYAMETTAEKSKASQEPKEAAPVMEEAREETATEDVAESPATADGTAGQTATAETEMAVNDSYSYLSDSKTEAVGGTEAVRTETTAEAAPEEAEPPLLRDGTEFLLTAADAGDLLAKFTPAAETETEALYLLSAQEYISLLTALPREVRQSAPANTAETMRVLVLK